MQGILSEWIFPTAVLLPALMSLCKLLYARRTELKPSCLDIMRHYGSEEAQDKKGNSLEHREPIIIQPGAER